MKRPTAEKALVFHPDLSKTRGWIYKYEGHEYAVSVPGMNKQEYVLIAKRNNEGVFQPCVRIEYGDARAKPARSGLVWTDLNDNGAEDPGETVMGFQGQRHYWSNGWMRPDMTFITPDQKVYPLKKFTDTGVPVYDFTHPETLPNQFKPDFRANGSGTVIMDMAGNISDGIQFATADGRKGMYPNPYGRHDAPAARKGLLIAPFRTNGVVENVPGVGSITALGGDRGEWFLMTMDGMYVSSLWQDSKGDVTLDETAIGQESFGGFIWRDETGRVLCQLGGPSYRIMELLGLDSMRLQKLTLKVTAEQVAEGMKLAQAKSKEGDQEAARLKVAKVEKLPREPVATDGGRKLALIPGAEDYRIQEPGDPTRWFRFAAAHDGKSLALMFQVSDTSPWLNGEGRFSHAFIGGDAVDVQLDIPGRGLVRLLASPVGGKNGVTYWQKTAEKKENPTTYVVANNEQNAQHFDVVKRLGSAKVAVSTGQRAYSTLVTIPLADLGLDASSLTELRGIVGVIFSDSSGQNRAARLYWHDKTTGLVSDVPSEARLNPANWGPVEISR